MRKKLKIDSDERRPRRVDVGREYEGRRFDCTERMSWSSEDPENSNDRVHAEEALKASHRFLQIANRNVDMKALLNDFVAEIQQMTACEAVGIRILQESGLIPYEAHIGFESDFYQFENPLCIRSDDCMCAHVIKGTTDPALSFYSTGAFVISSTTQFVASLPDAERKRIRSACSAYGYESLALVPIQMGQRVLGLIHIADHLPDQIPGKIIGLLEDIALQLGAAIQRINAEEELREAYGKLEDRVEARTLELTRTNRQLRREIEERKKTELALKLNESRLETLHRLSQMGTSSLQEICDFAVQQAVRLTQSEYGYLFFMNPDETKLTVHAWSPEAMAICAVPGMPRVYCVSDTGLWGEAVRQRKPIITNNYVENTLRKGIPEGHVPIKSHMNIPVFDRERIVAVAGVANKNSDYVENDVRQLQLLMKGMWRHIQRKNAREALQKSEAKLRFLSSQLLVAQEKERKRIAHELHDELGQALLTLKLQLRAMYNQLGDDRPRLQSEFDYVFKHINSVTENVRRLSKDLSPSVLEDLGLVAALNGLIKPFGKHHYMEITCDLEGLDGWFDRQKELLIFRVIQEALTNIAKHARSRKVRITAKNMPEGMVLVIKDKGVGFDVEQVMARTADKRGLGLAAMDERVRILGGQLDILSITNEGTRVIVNIPIHRNLHRGEG